MDQGQDGMDVEDFLAGNGEAFDRLVLRHKDRVFNLCYRLLGDCHEAEDCAQDTFVKVFRSLKHFRFESGFSTWLYAIAVNTCKNKRKSAEFRFWRRILSFGGVSEEQDAACEPAIEDPAPSPLATLAEREQERLLQAAIASLPHDHRTVIVLRHVEGLSHEEICRITGFNLGTLKSKLSRGRLQLQKLLSNEHGLERHSGGTLT